MDLRNKTNLPMMTCKKALESSDGDENGALEYIRKTGIQTRINREQNEMPHGQVSFNIEPISPSASFGVAILLGCQTDFVANLQMFKDTAQLLAQVAREQIDQSGHIITLEDFKKLPSVEIMLTDLVSVTKENIQVLSLKTISGNNIVGYNHGGKIATLVSGTDRSNKLKQIALHVTSANPIPQFVNRENVDQTLLENEIRIINDLDDVKSKPEKIRPKIVEGRLGKFYKEVCLLDQEMLLDNEKGETVQGYCTRNNIQVDNFIRLSV